MINIKVVSKPDLRKREKEVSKAFESGVLKLIKSGAKYMQDIIPVKTGDLRDSINWDENGIWSTSEYFKYVDEDTKPHKIEGSPLVFNIGGTTVFSTYVMHPGTKGQNLTDKTIKYIEKNTKIVVKDINKVI